MLTTEVNRNRKIYEILKNKTYYPLNEIVKTDLERNMSWFESILWNIRGGFWSQHVHKDISANKLRLL